jgi:hypothetical protein
MEEQETKRLNPREQLVADLQAMTDLVGAGAYSQAWKEAINPCYVVDLIKALALLASDVLQCEQGRF